MRLETVDTVLITQLVRFFTSCTRITQQLRLHAIACYGSVSRLKLRGSRRFMTLQISVFQRPQKEKKKTRNMQKAEGPFFLE